ncbi:MAG: tRNA (adenosine(37)-N6)-dimethylallyltransferase MiaA [Cellvibrionales bacterium]|nr:tRNA (adenosine(37)-N6)-dimethylallyltransferase MiaA [Cellvibrionales bacterium]
MNKQLPPALFIMGPTASGKTALALALAEKLNGEIISVDSALIYREMDIGTAKPTAEELAICPHHLIDIIDPTESYSSSNFREDALALMKEITERSRLPILVGGTMMYFKHLLQGMSRLPEADPAIRKAIDLIAQESGWGKVHELLKAVDPESAERLNPNDAQRLQRALEVYRITGKSMTEHRIEEHKTPFSFPYDVCQLALGFVDRSQLHAKIAERFEIMLSNGFEDEVRALRARGDLTLALPSMRAVGYRQMWMYQEGAYGYQEMKEKSLAATRQLAKRQFTWLKSWQNVNWFYTDADDCSMNKQKHLKKIEREALALLKSYFNGRLI